MGLGVGSRCNMVKSGVNDIVYYRLYEHKTDLPTFEATKEEIKASGKPKPQIFEIYVVLQIPNQSLMDKRNKSRVL